MTEISWNICNEGRAWSSDEAWQKQGVLINNWQDLNAPNAVTRRFESPAPKTH